jgi:hypothetical protein
VDLAGRLSSVRLESQAIGAGKRGGAGPRRSQAGPRAVGRRGLRNPGGAAAEEPARSGGRAQGRPVFRDGFGAAFVDYYISIKNAEIERFEAEISAGSIAIEMF